MTVRFLRHAAVIAATSAAALLTGPSQAQRPPAPEVQLFSGSQFDGSSFFLTGPQAFLNIGFNVRSARIPQGWPWEFCSRENFRDCRTYHGDIRNVRLTIRSARPVHAWVEPGPPAQPGPSLRGMASEYFVAPGERGWRVEVPSGNANAAANAANNFCRRAGWTRSAYQRLETVRGRVYLADVLCVRSM